MVTTLKLTGIDVTVALQWKSLHTRETLGSPDELTADVSDFRDGGPLSVGLFNLLALPESVLAAVVDRDGDIRFSGHARVRRGTKNAKGVLTWSLNGTGWEALAAKRLVGTPAGDVYMIQEDGDPDRLPTAVAIDGAAQGSPYASEFTALWQNYWAFPPIDLTTYVFDIVPIDAPIADTIYFSGTDLAGATSELCAAGSAAAKWWLGNDAPVAGSALSPHLALHVGNIVMPDDGDEGDDLLAGFPSADQPINVAPYMIDNDNPDWIAPTDDASPGDSIMATEITVDYDLGERDDAVYVRGATGFTEEVLEAPISFPVPYQIGPVMEGGTGWVGTPRSSLWGESYIDAPAAVTPSQRDSFGNAWLASHNFAAMTVTFKVVGWHGWHKGQAVRVTDSDYGLDRRWVFIQSVEAVQHDPVGDADEYTVTAGDVLKPDIGYALRAQRLQEQHKEIAPATRFIPYVGDLQLSPGETAPLTMQLANDAGKAMAVAGVPARWGLLVNGVALADPEDTAEAFYLEDLILVTDALGQITATLHANTTMTADDAAKPFAVIDLPVTP